MALLMVMTVCLLVYAALEYRIRTGLTTSQATFPSQKGQPVQNPYKTPQPAECSSTLAAFTCYTFLERGPSYSICMISTDNCYESWGPLMRPFIHKNAMRFVECRS
jgi:transposase